MSIVIFNPTPKPKKGPNAVQAMTLIVCLFILIIVGYLVAIHAGLLDPCCEPAFICCDLSLDFNFGA